MISSGLICLALNIYNESRGETKMGQQAVALVTLNRVKSSAFPNDICSVVFQKNQFSWTKKGKLGVTDYRSKEWMIAVVIAHDTMNGKIYDFTHGALYFNTLAMSVRWKTDVKPIIVNNHIFY